MSIERQRYEPGEHSVPQTGPVRLRAPNPSQCVGRTNLEIGRELAVALITATLNLRYGDGDADLFEQALSDASASRRWWTARSTRWPTCAGTLANIAAHGNGVDTLEWWSAMAQQITLEGTDLAEPVITPVMRATYTLAECSVVADKKCTVMDSTSAAERDLLLSQVNETIDTLHTYAAASAECTATSGRERRRQMRSPSGVRRTLAPGLPRRANGSESSTRLATDRKACLSTASSGWTGELAAAR